MQRGGEKLSSAGNSGCDSLLSGSLLNHLFYIYKTAGECLDTDSISEMSFLSFSIDVAVSRSRRQDCVETHMA